MLARVDGDMLDLSHLVFYDENFIITKEPLKKELKAALQSISKDSNPGLNGFDSNFYPSCWEFIKDDLMEVATELFNGAPLLRFFSSSYIVLISKVLDPIRFDKFKSIHLC